MRVSQVQFLAGSFLIREGTMSVSESPSMGIIPYARQSLQEEEIEAVARVLRSDFLTTGPTIEAFERAVAGQVGARHAVAVANGTLALHLACAALDLSPGYLGLTSPLTFAASANAILYTSGRVGFVDIGIEDPCMDPSLLEDYCKNNRGPDLVIPVSFSGIPADLPAIHRLAKQYGFKVIEDAAHSLGSDFRAAGQAHHSAGCTFSDLSILSFHPVKNITSAEGGMILTNSDHLNARLRELRNHGMSKDPQRWKNRDLGFSGSEPNGWYYEIQSLGFNARLSDVHAAIGLVQLKKLPDWKKRRAAIVQKYMTAFKELEDVRLPLPHTRDVDPCYHLFPLRLTGKKASERRGRLYRHLHRHGILAQVHYVPLHLQPLYATCDRGELDHAEAYYAGEISLPLYPAMTDSQVETVIQAVRDYFLKHR